eukprot:1159889-Pelagomonas_calceolata.AAC.4
MKMMICSLDQAVIQALQVHQSSLPGLRLRAWRTHRALQEPGHGLFKGALLFLGAHEVLEVCKDLPGRAPTVGCGSTRNNSVQGYCHHNSMCHFPCHSPCHSSCAIITPHATPHVPSSLHVPLPMPLLMCHSSCATPHRPSPLHVPLPMSLPMPLLMCHSSRAIITPCGTPHTTPHVPLLTRHHHSMWHSPCHSSCAIITPSVLLPTHRRVESQINHACTCAPSLQPFPPSPHALAF